MISAFLQACREYLRLEDLSSSEIDKGQGDFQKVFDEGVQISGNRLVLRDASLFNQVKRLSRIRQENTDTDHHSIALAFPNIYRVATQNGKQVSKYRPLFTIDISRIFRGAYREAGWDLLEFDIYPVRANLIELRGMNEQKADALLTGEGLLRFLADAFDRPFDSVQNFLNQVDTAPSPYRTKREAYIVRANLNPFNYNLRKEIQELEQQVAEQQNGCEWMSEDRPAHQYLFGKPQRSRHEVQFWAAFPGTVPDEYQAEAIKHAQENPLTPVLGGPGSGKTELSLHLVTQPIYERAKALAHGDPDQSCLCVFASTNNSAIDNFESRIRSRLPDDLFYLKGGKVAIIRGQTVPQLRQAITRLEEAEYDCDEHEEIKQKFLAFEAELQQRFDQEPALRQQQTIDEASLSEINSNITTLEEIAALQSLDAAEEIERDFSQFPLEAYEQIQEELDKVWEKFSQSSNSLLKKASDLLFPTTESMVIRQFERRVRPAWTHVQTTLFPFRLPINPAQVAERREQVAQLLAQSKRWQQQQKRRQALQETRQQIDKLYANRDSLQARLQNYPQQDIYSRFYQEDHDRQVQLFHAAWALLQHESLRHKSEVLSALRTYCDALLGDEEARLEMKLNSKSVYRLVSLVFPVFSSSLQSLFNLFPTIEADLIQLAIIDEAAATALHQAFPLLVRSQQAAVVGDPNQLFPILSLGVDAVAAYRQSYFLDQGLDYSKYSPTAKNTATAYHRAAGATGEEGSLGNPIVLRNHYRSVPAIAAFSSPKYPGGLNCLVQPRPSALGPNLLAFNVIGRQDQNTNPGEVRAIDILVQHLLAAGYKLTAQEKNNQIGIMSLFFHQAAALRQQLQSRSQKFPWSDVNTVYQFQGEEKPVILFSPCLCDRNSLGLISNSPNLLNTVVSRAEELFILVGNLAELEAVGGEARRLINHIRQYGEVRNLPD